MKIIPVSNYDEMSARAAEILVEQAISKPQSLFGLATGSTPIGTYNGMIAAYRAGRVSFAGCKSVNLDEYVGLDHTDEQSYVTFMRENLFNHIDMKPENIHIPNGKNLDNAAECARYDQLLADLGPIDVQVLGIGHNGHIAFNEPADHFSPGTHKVDLDEVTIDANQRFFDCREDVPRAAYSMGLAPIMQASCALLLVTGEAKAEILCRSLTGPITPQVPASILQLHQNLILIADDAARQVLDQA